MGNVLRAGQISALSPELLEMFGSADDPMETVDARARAMYPDAPPIIWECNLSFQFSYVSESAVTMLGYPRQRWLESLFWAEQVVHADDQEDAITYCGLATAKARNHMFEYRARSADGRTLWLRDYVKVILGPSGAPVKVRGAMFDVSAEKVGADLPPARVPSRADLVA